MTSSLETIKVDGSDKRMYFSILDESWPFPAVLVSQHRPGLNGFIHDIVNNLAKEGYIARAPDLYHRVKEKIASDPSRLSDYNSDVDIISDLNATVEYLRGHPVSLATG